ncbi:hypothetical protein FIBSPDRAFT_1044309 [Athelia psychrophila]|uniref:Uncharacterized protein n=1 Tax=Athelia psychrophila TaxID=1759441 RepID=A0A166JRK4_9AGAM|nr:hypothetical protein FIBSPDRAFT_1044309 [Fibularhizoctonia sp. CBS 109695]
MRPDSEDRQRLALSLTRRLEVIATGRRDLALQQENFDRQEKDVQQENFDRQEKAVQQEFKSLHNMNAAISIFPSEVLSMVFEAGALLDSSPRCHFGSLVSYVSQRWRKIALATPQLWNKIECTRSKAEGEEYTTYITHLGEKVATFLSRSKSSPIDIRIQDFYDEYQRDDKTRNFLTMLGDQVGHVNHLCIIDNNPDGVFDALKYLSHKPASILHSVLLGTHDDLFQLKRPLFPFGAPRLTIAQLNNIATSSLHFCLPSFQHLQCLRLEGIVEIDRHEFRDALMALPVLNHLELSVDRIFQNATSFSVVLPTVKFLQIETHGHDDLDRVIHTIHATSLTTLSLALWGYGGPGLNLSSEEDLESHFPALQHLILEHIIQQAPDLEMVARMFPGIERLTCNWSTSRENELFCDIDRILATIDTGSSGDSLRWPKLHTVAVSAPGMPLDVGALHHKISMMRDAGHPLRKLKLPKSLFVQTGAKAIGHLRQIVDVEDFSLDWPTPFAGLTIEVRLVDD